MIAVDYKVNENTKLAVQVNDCNSVFQFLSMCDTMFGVKECGNCASPDLAFKYTTPQGYEYYSIQCRGCRHELKFGQRKEDHTLFAKGWEAPYERGESDGDTNQDRGERQSSRRGSQEGDDEIPFGRPSEASSKRSNGRGF